MQFKVEGRALVVSTDMTDRPRFDNSVSKSDSEFEASVIIAQHAVGLKPSTAHIFKWEVEIIKDGSNSNTIKAFASAKESTPNIFLYEKRDAAAKGRKQAITQTIFTPSHATPNQPLLVDIGLRWTKDPYETCNTEGCPKQEVKVLSFSVEEDSTPEKDTSVVASAISVISIGASTIAQTAVGAVQSTSMGFVAQLQFSGILAKMKGCPDEFKVFASGFDWTLLDWPLPWESAFQFPWESAATPGPTLAPTLALCKVSCTHILYSNATLRMECPNGERSFIDAYPALMSNGLTAEEDILQEQAPLAAQMRAIQEKETVLSDLLCEQICCATSTVGNSNPRRSAETSQEENTVQTEVEGNKATNTLRPLFWAAVLLLIIAMVRFLLSALLSWLHRTKIPAWKANFQNSNLEKQMKLQAALDEGKLVQVSCNRERKQQPGDLGPEIWGGKLAWKKYKVSEFGFIMMDVLPALTVFPRWELGVVMISYQAVCFGVFEGLRVVKATGFANNILVGVISHIVLWMYVLPYPAFVGCFVVNFVGTKDVSKRRALWVPTEELFDGDMMMEAKKLKSAGVWKSKVEESHFVEKYGSWFSSYVSSTTSCLQRCSIYFKLLDFLRMFLLALIVGFLQHETSFVDRFKDTHLFSSNSATADAMLPVLFVLVVFGFAFLSVVIVRPFCDRITNVTELISLGVNCVLLAMISLTNGVTSWILIALALTPLFSNVIVQLWLLYIAVTEAKLKKDAGLSATDIALTLTKSVGMAALKTLGMGGVEGIVGGSNGTETIGSVTQDQSSLQQAQFQKSVQASIYEKEQTLKRKSEKDIADKLDHERTADSKATASDCTDAADPVSAALGPADEEGSLDTQMADQTSGSHLTRVSTAVAQDPDTNTEGTELQPVPAVKGGTTLDVALAHDPDKNTGETELQPVPAVEGGTTVDVALAHDPDMKPLAAEKQAFALSSGLYKVFVDLKIEDKLRLAVDWFKSAGAEEISDLEAEDRAAFVRSLALPHIKARKLKGAISPQEPQMATLPPMAIPVAPAMPIPRSTSSGSFEPTPQTAKLDNLEDTEETELRPVPAVEGGATMGVSAPTQNITPNPRSTTIQ